MSEKITFERVDNGSLTWYDLDMPDVIHLRRKLIQETDRRKFIAASFLDQGWTKEIEVAQNVLFLAAGVFYYFTADEIRQFLIRLVDEFPRSEILFDTNSPHGVKVANKKVITSSGLGRKIISEVGIGSSKNPPGMGLTHPINRNTLLFPRPWQSVSLEDQADRSFFGLAANPVHAAPADGKELMIAG